MLQRYLQPGDWVVDVGANIGHFCRHLAEAVGPTGRVVAFEPLPETFELLSRNVQQLNLENVTLVNAAASDGYAEVALEVPRFSTGLRNPYMAHLSPDADGPKVMCVPVDAIVGDHRVALVKIDAEGHDMAVLLGMDRILRASRPVLIVEDRSPEILALLEEMGYRWHELPGSDNRVFFHDRDPMA